MSENGADRVISFPEGIPGFEEVKSFTLNTEDDTTMARLEGIGSTEIVFYLVRPQLFLPDYLPQVNLAPHEIEMLDICQGDSVDVWNIITVCSSDLAKSTVNLRAPLILNTRSNKGIQLIISDDGYSSRHPLFSAELQTGQTKNAEEGAED